MHSPPRNICPKGDGLTWVCSLFVPFHVSTSDIVAPPLFVSSACHAEKVVSLGYLD